jgi:hypothetical protein
MAAICRHQFVPGIVPNGTALRRLPGTELSVVAWPAAHEEPPGRREVARGSRSSVSHRRAVAATEVSPPAAATSATAWGGLPGVAGLSTAATAVRGILRPI